MKTRLVYLTTNIILLLLFMGCSSKSKYEVAFKIVKHEVLLTESASNKDSLFKEQYDLLFEDETFIKFFDNDSLTLLNNHGLFAVGTWSNNPTTDSIFFMNINNIGKISFLKQDEEGEGGEFEYLVLKSKSAKGLIVNLLLKKDYYYESKKTDLLSVSSNWWRVKPTKKETKDQIKKRVIAQIDFMLKYFELIDDKQYTTFKTTPLICPYSLYSTGMDINPSELTEYNKLFYDYDDAATAYELLDKGLKSISVYPADSETFTKGYSNALKEIRKFIELS
ncbi:hypothetical protein VB264_04580 [Arcicella aquatica]|uniref:Lipoprotein n=1 Tax=Arcicella aquatica TaxID=217141 RepID=A0ABU5QJU5_9BACT|nr:hypothetical protein [Arcicella aquatica]MEA5257050.1 hypothetical protein [Arcicella aquatica]